jgi:D-aminopeptidase
MRIYISIDIEGVAGAVVTDQTSPGGARITHGSAG